MPNSIIKPYLTNITNYPCDVTEKINGRELTLNGSPKSPLEGGVRRGEISPERVSPEH